MSHLVTIGTYNTEMDANVAAAALDAHGIWCRVLADNAGGALPAMSFAFPIRLLVEQEDSGLAREILAGISAADEAPES